LKFIIGARAIQVWLNNAAKLVTSSVPFSRIPKEEKELYQTMLDVGLLVPHKRIKTDKTKVEEQDELKEGVDAILDAIEADSVIDDIEGILDEDLDDKEFVKLKNDKGPMKITPMTWTSPLGFPIVQPYRKSSVAQVKTYLQTFTIRESSAASPVNPMKQSSAFPPNFVHSLDASHMMLTCLSCHQRSLTFAAVHDSYWTHACDVDTMSELLRDAFIRLHSKNIMERLHEELYSRFGQNRINIPIQISTKEQKELWEEVCRRLGKKSRKVSKINVWVPFTLPPLPEKGAFEVQEVRHSPYFFH
jgi:DNA-directed RNA polymerase